MMRSSSNPNNQILVSIKIILKATHFPRVIRPIRKNNISHILQSIFILSRHPIIHFFPRQSRLYSIFFITTSDKSIIIPRLFWEHINRPPVLSNRHKQLCTSLIFPCRFSRFFRLVNIKTRTTTSCIIIQIHYLVHSIHRIPNIFF